MIRSQSPTAGSFNIYRRGDVFQLHLHLKDPTLRPYLRTSLGGAKQLRSSIINAREREITGSENNWRDLPLIKKDDDNYSITLPLHEVGYFEAKLWFTKKDQPDIIWAPGENIYIKVEPASTIAHNSIYGVFTRQFGPNKGKAFALNEDAENIKILEDKGYHVIPPSGTFRDVINALDHIMGTMGFRILQLLPIHPCPTTFARMGRFGSPYAALDFFAVDPALAEFDKQATPLDQFEELVDAVHQRQGEIFLDIPVDHTGWASTWQKDHPEYFVRDNEGHFVSPGAWGTTWEDLIKLDFNEPEVHQMMAKVFLFWCDKGVDGFRCDAGYMVPFEAWEYIIAKVREQYPETIFLLEGLGGPPELTEELLSKATFSWAYSELFQNYSYEEVKGYLAHMLQVSARSGGMVNFSETHDNLRLAGTSKAWSRMRNLLCALSAPSGAFGISNGGEFYAEEKISVHQASGLHWGNEDNLKGLFHRINELFVSHPAFWANAQIELLESPTPELLLLKRQASSPGNAPETVFIAINLNLEHESAIDYSTYIKTGNELLDLISNKSLSTAAKLSPGQAHCIVVPATNTDHLQHNKTVLDSKPIERQGIQTIILQCHVHLNGFSPLPDHYIQDSIKLIQRDPIAFCLSEGASLGQVVKYDILSDHRRIVMACSGGILLLQGRQTFHFQLKRKETNLCSGMAISQDEHHFFTLIPLDHNETQDMHRLELTVKTEEKGQWIKRKGNIALLPEKDKPTFRQVFSFKETRDKACYGFCANRSGSMSQVSGVWGSYTSKYDAFLAANLDPKVPVDRTTLLSRLRCWVVYNEFSHELGPQSQYRFAADGASHMTWSFKAPTGQGKYILLDIHLHLDQVNNSAEITFVRKENAQLDNLLDAQSAIELIIRPDIEYRSNHEVSKAFMGPEKLFPQSLNYEDKGFAFDPYHSLPLYLTVNEGHFHPEAEWQYMQHLPVEQQRGLEDHTDLFSPGYFKTELKTEQTYQLCASVGIKAEHKATHPMTISDYGEREEVLKRAIRTFIIKRDEGQTVVAGYPWFLDWGRDTLICLRGIIAADMQQEAKDILLTFAKYEEEGTLPNMIRGNNASNRDTSDAPLWFVVAVKEYSEHFKDPDVLFMKCGEHTVLEVIKSIVSHYARGTRNGIRMDEDSALIYSPPHFTWMDTNYPAGTPREGYPIEIQALWQAAVHYLSTIEKEHKWTALADKIRDSILHYYPLNIGEGLSDCLHTKGYQKAAEAVKDNACRPNQLFAVTLNVISDKTLVKSIIEATQSLIIPGAIRSLKDATIEPPLAIYHEGHLLNDPTAPYWGNYEGDEDTRRKPAYHNGTGWAWPFFSYCEALYMYSKDESTSLAILMSAKEEMEKGIINQMPEICDGNAPHAQRGCQAQAWSITEFYRVLKKIKQ